MWVVLGIRFLFVSEDVVDGSRGDHVQGEGGAGGVKAVGLGDDQVDAPVESFVPGIVDAESNRSQDPRSSFADGGGEGDEPFEAAALCFGAKPVQEYHDVGFVQVGVEHRT